VTGVLKRLLKFRVLVALALIVWCAGTGCLLVCYAGEPTSLAAEATSSASETMSGMPACHAHLQNNKRVAKSETPALDKAGRLNAPAPSRSGVMSCCPLTSGLIAAASRAQSNDAAPLISNPSTQLHNLIRSTNNPLAIPLRLPNRAHSYLLDCAFLI
jgi:hypothetical protein